MERLWKKIGNLQIIQALTVGQNALIKLIGNSGGFLAAPINCGSTRTLLASQAGRTIVLDQAAGCTVTLPAAVGSGARYRLAISVTATSNSHVVKVGNANDYMRGILMQLTDDATPYARAWETANTGTVATESDTITLNRTTTGTAKSGHYIEVEDIAPNIWHVRGMTGASGAEATPFSAAV